MYVQLVGGMDAFPFGPRVRSVLPLDHQKEPGETIRPTQVRSADRELPFHRIGDASVANSFSEVFAPREFRIVAALAGPQVDSVLCIHTSPSQRALNRVRSSGPSQGFE